MPKQKKKLQEEEDEEYLDLNVEDLNQLLGKGEEKKNSSYEIYENEFYLYDDITQESMIQLTKFIRSREKELIKFNNKYWDIIESLNPKPVKIFINSNGGDLHAVLPVVDLIVSLKDKIPIYTYIEGIAASAASILSIVGHKRFITKNSFMLIHELRTQVQGTFSNFKDESSNCNLIMEQLKTLYLNNSKDNTLDKNRLEELLQHDLLLSSNTCEKLGLIDEIIG